MKRKDYISLKKALYVVYAFVLVLCSRPAYTQTTYTFVYTGNTQTINLPAGNYSIECWGGDGGSGNNGTNLVAGGKGGYASGVFTNSAAATFNVYVGGKGGNASNAAQVGGGGGGMSDVAPASNPTLIIIAAGGGGGSTSGGTLNENSTGGNGGGLVGGTAQDGAGVTGGTAATGGSQSAGGFATAGSYGAGSAGGYGYGGGAANGGSAGTIHGAGGAGGNGGNGGWNGGGGGCTLTGINDHAAGGGAGYYGGGGGRGDGGAGGGGSSFIGGVSSGTTIMFGQPGFVTNPDLVGNGRILIRELCGISLYASTANSLSPVICNGQSLTLSTNAISNYSWSTGSNASSINISPTVTTTYSLTAMSPSMCMTSAAITVTVSSGVPVLTISASSGSTCLGNTVSISASGALTYSFSGGISNGVAFAPAATTAYTIQGQNGCGISTSVTTITVAPLPVQATASSTLVCAGSTTSLNASGASSYTWQPGGITGANIQTNVQATTIYTVDGMSGNCSGSFTLQITANPAPTIVAASSNSSICQGQSATLTASGGLSYTWQPGGLTGSLVVVNPSSSTGYLVSGNNSFGCLSTAQQALPVFASPTLNLSTNTPTICSGSTAILLATGANSYSWSTGAQSNTVSVSPANTTVYTVVGTNTTTQCSDTKSFTLNVFVPAVALNPSTSICIGESATLTASGAVSYQWSGGGIGPVLAVNPQSTTVYTVTGFTPVGNETCFGTATTTVVVNLLPTVTAVPSRSSICRNESTTLTASGASSYTWSNSQTGASIVVSPLSTTVYTLTGTDANNCKGNGSTIVTVNTCVGLTEEIAANRFSVYPNPSSGMIHLVADRSMILLLSNELGQVLHEIKLEKENGYSLSLEGLAKGLYFIRSTDPVSPVYYKLLVE